jgi:tetratricopeptide (TPR) repeat protein
VLLKECKYRECINVATNGLSIESSADGYLICAKAYLAIDDLKSALKSLDICTQQWPFQSSGEAYYLKARLLRFFGEYPQSLENLLLSGKLGMDKYRVLMELWSHYYSRRCYNVCIKIASDLITLFPRSDAAYVAAAASCNALGDYKEAQNHAKSALRLEPKNHQAFVEIAWSYVGMSDYVLAIKSFDKAITIDPRSPEALCGKAILLASCPKSSIRDGFAACKLAKEACEITKWSRPYCVVAFSISNLEAGNHEKSVEFIEKALHLLPNFRNNRKLLYEGLQSDIKLGFPAVIINTRRPFRLFIELP